MSRAEAYHFADFTRANYRRLIGLAKVHYRFRTFADFCKDERFVLWRHDVDVSPQGAVRMAEIEAEEGVVATYLVGLHSPFYNLLERDVSDCVRRILALGHDVGIHFDPDYYGLSDVSHLEPLLDRERHIVEHMLGHRARAFSFHNNTPMLQACGDWEYAGLIHCHAAYFQSEVGYCSDSNGFWRHRRLEDVLAGATDERLQVLTHPELWQDEPMPPRQRIRRSVDGRAAATLSGYDALLQSAGRENIDE
jgi:hypothetical protein